MSIAFGIDPGSHRTGWGIVHRQGSSLRALGFGVITAEGSELAPRLVDIFDALTAKLESSEAVLVALESVFHHRSARSALVLGQARGVALLVAAQSGRTIVEVTPAEVKKMVAGSGRASKEQIARLVEVQLGIRCDGVQNDATDALAVAIAGLTKHTTAARLKASASMRAKGA